MTAVGSVVIIADPAGKLGPPMPREIGALTGLRGIAASWVVLYHTHEFDPISGPLAEVLRHGYLAVDVFFLLSGFVIGLSYEHLFAPGYTSRAYGVFMLRRFGRIYPLYFIITIIMTVGMILQSVTAWSILSIVFGLNVLLVQAWGLGFAIDGPSWSISTELLAYLLFPLLACMTIYTRLWRAVLVAIGCMAVLILLARVPTDAAYHYPRMGPLDISWPGTFWPVVRCLPEFCIGLATLRVAASAPLRRLAAQERFALSVLIGLMALLALPNTDLLIVLLVPGLLLTLAAGDGPVVRLFSSRLALFLGDISFAMYLLHFPLLTLRKAATDPLSGLLGAAGANVATLAAFYGLLLLAAWCCFNVIERPARRAIRNLERRLFPEADHAGMAGKAQAIHRAGRPS